VFSTIAFSLSGLVLIPNWQFQEHQPVRNARDGSQYPNPYYGLARQGRDVYVDQGCAYCHSQQVRAKGYGADIRRNWGNRRTVARDYMYEYPILLGTMARPPTSPTSAPGNPPATGTTCTSTIPRSPRPAR
jgi:cytochrome c oxidase cbb3-type subunit 2